MANGIGLIHFIIVNKLSELLDKYFTKVPYDARKWSFNKAYHPLTLAIAVNDQEIFSVLESHLKDNPCIEFNEGLYWKAANLGHQGFRDLILSTLFFHSELEIEDLPSTFIVN